MLVWDVDQRVVDRLTWPLCCTRGGFGLGGGAMLLT